MDLSKQKLVLNKREVSDLAEVFSKTSQIGPNSRLRTYPRPLSDEEKGQARDARSILVEAHRSAASDEVEISAENFPTIRAVAELALANSQDVVGSLCTPDVCSGYRSEWRPAAFQIMAMTAEISEGIARQIES